MVASKKKHISKYLSENIVKSFTCPLSNMIQFLTITTAVFFNQFLGFGSPLMLALLIIVNSFICSYLFEIIAHSASGFDELPLFIPESKDLLGLVMKLGKNFFRVIAIIFTYSILPLTIFIKIGITNPILLISLCFSFLFLMPMAFISTVVNDGLSISPIFLIKPLKTLFIPYLVVSVMFYLSFIISGLIISKFQSGLVMFLIVSSLCNAYFYIVSMRLLGSFYWVYEKNFKCFNK